MHDKQFCMARFISQAAKNWDNLLIGRRTCHAEISAGLEKHYSAFQGNFVYPTKQLVKPSFSPSTQFKFGPVPCGFFPETSYSMDTKAYVECPRCTYPQRSLQSKGMRSRMRMVVDVKDYYYLAPEHHFSCSCCKGPSLHGINSGTVLWHCRTTSWSFTVRSGVGTAFGTCQIVIATGEDISR